MDFTSVILMIMSVIPFILLSHGLLESDHKWTQFWHKMRYGDLTNLRSSCPWTYQMRTNSKHCPSFSAVLHPYAQYSCIDLDRSSHSRAVYSRGKCQMIQSMCGPCGPMVIGYTCVYPEPADRKRNLDEEFIDSILTIKEVVGGFLAKFLNGTIRYLENEEIALLQLHVTNGTGAVIHANGTEVNLMHTNRTNAIQITNNSSINIDDQNNETLVDESDTYKGNNNSHSAVQDQRPSTPAVMVQTQSGQNQNSFLVPPFLKGNTRQFNGPPFLQGNNIQMRPPAFLRGMNPQLGLPPLLRPNQMHGFNGDTRQGGMNIHDAGELLEENTNSDTET